MQLRPGMRVLDVGCGVGGPARQIATFTGSDIVGVNNNAFQVGRARKYTQKMGLQDQVQFVKGDFMKLVEQFGENSFDAGNCFFFFSVLYGGLTRLYSVCYRGDLSCSYLGRCLR